MIGDLKLKSVSSYFNFLHFDISIHMVHNIGYTGMDVCVYVNMTTE